MSTKQTLDIQLLDSCLRIKTTSGLSTKLQEAADYLDSKMREIRTTNNTADMEKIRSEEHTSELQSRETISYAVFCLKKKKKKQWNHTILNS